MARYSRTSPKAYLTPVFLSIPIALGLSIGVTVVFVRRAIFT